LKHRIAVLGVLLTLAVTGGFASPPPTGDEEKAVKLAWTDKTVRYHVGGFRSSGLFDETLTVELREDGLYRVQWYFAPKCWKDSPPCPSAAQAVVAVVDLQTHKVVNVYVT
jgi:hypothetical protein